MLLALVPGKRDGRTCERLIRQVHDRTKGRADVLLTSDEHAPYETSIRAAYGVERPWPRRPGPGRLPKPVIAMVGIPGLLLAVSAVKPGMPSVVPALAGPFTAK